MAALCISPMANEVEPLVTWLLTIFLGHGSGPFFSWYVCLFLTSL